MRIAALALLVLSVAASDALVERHEVRMLNRNSTGAMIYEPDYLRLEPGDTVKFIAADATHNAASIPELLPPGAKPFKGQINQEIEVTFDVPGLYGVRCIPHWAMGMVMLIQVGASATSLPPLPADWPPEARDRFTEILKRQSRR